MAPKKEKAQKMQLGEFLQDTSLGSWADEMEDMPMPSPSGRPAWGGGDKSYGAGGGFGDRGAKDDRGFSFREELPLPSRPPYTVHLGNLSFDATEGDVADFFADCEVDNIRIVEDKLDSKPKGFGYIEFKTLDGLKKSLDLSGRQFQGRNIRVSVAEPQKDRQETRDFSDWSRKGPLPDAPQQGSRKGPERGGFPSSGGGFGSGDPRRGPPSGNFDAVSEAGSERGGRRGGFEPSDGKVRDFGNWDRKGPLTPTLSAGAPARSFERPVSRDGAPPNFRRNSPAWGEGRSQDSGSRPPRREFVERPVVERTPTAAEQDTQWRSKMKADAPPAPPVPSVAVTRSPALSQRELSNPPSPATSGSAAAATPAAPAGRPKLNLAKRTVSEANPDATAAPASDSKASPFGAARPIDTATREKEVEEKRQIALKEKKEADEKAREEKKIADDKAKEDRRLAKEAELANRSASKVEQSPKSPVQQNGDRRQLPRREKSESKPKPEKETNGGAQAPAPGKQYEILRRHAEEEGSAMDEEPEEVDANANGIVVGDKETKPQEVVRDPKADAHTNGATTQPASEPTTDALEEDGWNVVEKTGKKGKKNPTSRALAS